MFKRIVVPLLVAGGIFGAFALTVGYLVLKSRADPVEYITVEASSADIVLKTVATGAIVPRVEIALKSRVSGVVAELYVEPGDPIAAGDLVAGIQVIPDSATLNAASNATRSTRIQLDNAEEEHQRALALSKNAAISTAELERRRVAYELARQDHAAAVTNLQIVRDGASKGTGPASTEVRSTVAGMVLAVDVETGESVTETNTFNAGTTIGSVADMGDMVFEGFVDESEVGRLREGMGLELTVGALQDERFDATLEYISPKGVLKDGAVQFEIRAALALVPDAFIRAGSSANADIVLDRREAVLAIDERALQFEGDAVFVEVKRLGGWQRADVEVGLSDGLVIEVLSGLSAGDEVKAGEKR